MSDQGAVAPPEPIAASVPAEVPAVVVEPVAPAPPPSLITATPAEPAAQVPAAPDPAVEPAHSSPADPAAVEPVQPEHPAALAYEAFTWPEGFTPPAEDHPALTEFTAFGGENQVPQQVMQKFADLHAAEVARIHEVTQEALVQRQYDVFADTVKAWQQEFHDAPEFKNRVATVLGDANWAVRELSGSEEAATKAFQALELSGMGSHPDVIRLLAEAGKRLREPNNKPAQESRASPTTRNPDPAERRYQRMGTNT